MRNWLIIGGALVLLYGIGWMKQPTLKYFKSREFGPWWPLMDADLLGKLDLFREYWGAPVSLSGASGAIGRENESGSYHNVLKWGKVRATDVHPQGMNTAADRMRAYECAVRAGFSGIGIYAEWNTPGLHLDNRDTPLVWKGYNDIAGNQKYAYGVEGAFA